MVRMQIQFTEEQSRRLRELAQSRRVPITRVVREFVDEGLQSPGQPSREELVARVLALSGIGDSGLTDVSERHDDYLAEAYAQ
jgi:hypothetical protein